MQKFCIRKTKNKKNIPFLEHRNLVHCKIKQGKKSQTQTPFLPLQSENSMLRNRKIYMIVVFRFLAYLFLLFQILSTIFLQKHLNLWESFNVETCVPNFYLCECDFQHFTNMVRVTRFLLLLLLIGKTLITLTSRNAIPLYIFVFAIHIYIWLFCMMGWTCFSSPSSIQGIQIYSHWLHLETQLSGFLVSSFVISLGKFIILCLYYRTEEFTKFFHLKKSFL